MPLSFHNNIRKCIYLYICNLHRQVSNIIGYGTSNFLIILTLMVAFMGYVYIKYEEYYHKSDGGHCQEDSSQPLPSRWVNATRRVASDLADSAKLRIMEFLMAVGVFLFVAIICSVFLWWFFSLGSSIENTFELLKAFVSLNLYVAVFIFVLGGAYYVYNWNNRRAAITETEVMTYALKAKEFLISLRVADNDGVAMSMFIEEFLDHLKLGHPAKRKKIKNMWKEIEDAMLDDKRVVKTGRMSLPNGGTDSKYKYTKLATHSSKLYGNTASQPAFAFKSNANASTSDLRPSSPYAPRTGTSFFSSSTAYSSAGVPGARTLHKSTDPVMAQTGLKGASVKNATPASVPKKSGIFSAFWG